LFASDDETRWYGKVCHQPTDLAKTIKDLLLPHLQLL
jgi:hypothetical protein